MYLNPERRTSGVDEAAMDLLRRLTKGDRPAEGYAALGDRLMLPMELPLSRCSGIERLFGQRFADSIMGLKAGRWTGPIESSYGLHLVYASERTAARLPALDEVRDLVRREWLNDRRKELEKQFFQSLLQDSAVEVRMPGGSADATADGDSTGNAR